MKEITFERYAKMIDKKAWEVSQKTGVDFEELQGQGALIYCKTLNKYDISKSSFSTILYISLNQLYEYAYYFRDRKRDKTLTEKVEKSIEAMEINPSLMDFLEEAKEQLSKDAYSLIEWILNRTWEFQGKLKPCLCMVVKNFGWDRDYAKLMWAECKNFWNKSGWAMYC